MSAQSITRRSTFRQVFVLSAVQSATGEYGGALKDVPPADLATTVTREAVAGSGIMCIGGGQGIAAIFERS